MARDADELVDYAGFAAILRVQPSTVRHYRSAGRLPEPDLLAAPDRPRWKVSTVLAWQAARPGRGVGPRRSRRVK